MRPISKPHGNLLLASLPSHSAPEGEAVEKKVGTGGSGKVEEEDVKLVVAQTGCTPEKAREALEAENGDLINASESTVVLNTRSDL